MPGVTPFEVELKLRAGPGLLARMQALGIAFGPPVIQEDVFLRHAAQDFAARDEALRIRREEDRWTLTYKGPRQPGPAKVRAEHEVSVGSDPTPLLAALGYTEAARIHKRRRTAQWDGVALALDEVAGLGTFLELEVVTDGDVAQARAKVEAAARQLGLDPRQEERRAYVQMLAET